jgi:hypothetical protein
VELVVEKVLDTFMTGAELIVIAAVVEVELVVVEVELVVV